MNVDEPTRTTSVRIRPGASKVVFEGDGAIVSEPFLYVVATQTESLDDGGSQPPLATLKIGKESTISTQFDLREVAVVSVPSTSFTITVQNRNDVHQPVVEAWVYGCRAGRSTHNTRSFDLSFQMDQPNVRVPGYAESFIYNLWGGETTGYSALISDSLTGETYGLASPGVRYALTRRTRFVRFMDLPERAVGEVTFFLNL